MNQNTQPTEDQIDIRAAKLIVGMAVKQLIEANICAKAGYMKNNIVNAEGLLNTAKQHLDNAASNSMALIVSGKSAKFKLGDEVKKSRGAEWQGTVVGTYSTTLNPEGYAVESFVHQGSVQIYPASMLELVTKKTKEDNSYSNIIDGIANHVYAEPPPSLNKQFNAMAEAWNKGAI